LWMDCVASSTDGGLMEDRDCERSAILDLYSRLSSETADFAIPIGTLLETVDFVEAERSCGEVVGIGGLRNGKSGANHQLFLVVHKNYQGCGFGRSLLEAVIRRAASSHYPYIQLSVFESNRRALALYTGCRFRQISQAMVSGRKIVWMVLPISCLGWVYIPLKALELRVRRVVALLRRRSEHCGGSWWWD